MELLTAARLHGYKPKPFTGSTPQGVVMKLPDSDSRIVLRARAADLPNGREGFNEWLKREYGDKGKAILNRADTDRFAESFLGATDGDNASTAAPSWVTAIQNAASAILPIYQQKKIVDIQLDRAKKGLKPLDVSAYGDASSLKVGVDSSTQKTVLMIAGIAGAALVLMMLLRKHR